MSVVLDLMAPARTLSTKPESLTAHGPAGALNNGVTKEEIVEAFIQISAYAGAARAFESYGIAAEVFGEQEP
jgi:alkylhydroperoxidase/carboxymuconolactone decarboxylase family protein YurZ